MHLIRNIFIIGIVLIPLVYSTSVKLDEGFLLPKLENIEADIDNLWSNFKKGYGIEYNTAAEDIHRFKIFADHVKMIIKHNIEHDLGLISYRLGLNKFAVFTGEEFLEKFTGFKNQNDSRSELSDLRRPFTSASPHVPLPLSIDWRNQGIVTPVKNQGKCGACWAFSAAAAIESHHARSTGKLVDLSEQQLVDCSTNGGNMGCGGGFMEAAYKYVHDKKGLVDERSYPYTETDAAECQLRQTPVVATCDGFVEIPPGNEAALQEAIAVYGPVSVAIVATRSLQFYQDGVFWDWTCASQNLNHAVLAVGYGVDYDLFGRPQEYYIVKNSWSENWGKNGYGKIARNMNNMCGISTDASFPIVKDNPVQTEVISD